MSMDEHDHDEQDTIKLDGSIGTGNNALLTVITKDEVNGDKEETFLTPYALIDQSKLSKFCDVGLILGYKIVKKQREQVEQV